MRQFAPCCRPALFRGLRRFFTLSSIRFDAIPTYSRRAVTTLKPQHLFAIFFERRSNHRRQSRTTVSSHLLRRGRDSICRALTFPFARLENKSAFTCFSRYLQKEIYPLFVSSFVRLKMNALSLAFQGISIGKFIRCSFVRSFLTN